LFCVFAYSGHFDTERRKLRETGRRHYTGTHADTFADHRLKTFITQRWQGRIGWRRLFWRDLLVVGTSLNLLMTGLALALLSQDVAIPWVLLAHLFPLPYNLLIVSSIWSAPQRPKIVLVASLCWLVLFVAV
jgi:hypothetical protein